MPSSWRTVSRNLRLCASALALLVFGGGCDSDPDPVATTIDISPARSVLKDAPDTVLLTATVRDQNGEAMPSVPVAWSASDSGFVVRLSIDGLVTARGPGTVIVRVSAATVIADATVVVLPGPRAVLQKTYRVMGGEDWVHTTNWKTDEPLGTWYGVDTDTLGNVTRLALRDNGLTGSIPPELGDLRSLEHLLLDSNQVTGSIPPELGQLDSLRDLSLSSNSLAGSIPPELGGMQRLDTLDLSRNELTGSIPPELGGMQRLETLDLSRNELTGSIPPELGGMQRLETLHLSRNELTGSIPPELGQLYYLWSLSLAGNSLTGSIPPELGQLGRKWHGIRWLDLSENELTGSLPGELGEYTYIVALRVADNPLEGPIPGSLTKMRFIDTFHWHVTDLCAPTDEPFQLWLNNIRDVGFGRWCDS